MDVDCVDTSATEAVASHRPAAPDMLLSTVRTVKTASGQLQPSETKLSSSGALKRIS